jgi:hypothetical protein
MKLSDFIVEPELVLESSTATLKPLVKDMEAAIEFARTHESSTNAMTKAVKTAILVKQAISDKEFSVKEEEKVEDLVMAKEKASNAFKTVFGKEMDSFLTESTEEILEEMEHKDGQVLIKLGRALEKRWVETFKTYTDCIVEFKSDLLEEFDDDEKMTKKIQTMKDIDLIEAAKEKLNIDIYKKLEEEWLSEVRITAEAILVIINPKQSKLTGAQEETLLDTVFAQDKSKAVFKTLFDKPVDWYLQRHLRTGK